MNRKSNRVSSNIFLMLTSLLMAVIVWLIAKESELGLKTLAVPLVVTHVPASVEVASRDRSVHITMNVPTSLATQLQSEYFRIELDWNRMPDLADWCGITDFGDSPNIPLQANQIALTDQVSANRANRIRNKALRNVTIEPSEVRVRARYITRRAEIVFQTENAVAEGFELAGPIALAEGSIEIILNAQKSLFVELGAENDSDLVEIQTRPIDLTGREQDFTTTTELDLPPEVNLLPPQQSPFVEVRVPVRQIMETRTLEGVGVVLTPRNPNLLAEYPEQTVRVTILGPRGLIRALQPSDLVVQAAQPPSENVDQETVVPLAASFAPGVSGASLVKIRALDPEVARVTFRPRNPVREVTP